MNTVQNKYQVAEPVSQHFLPLAAIVLGFSSAWATQLIGLPNVQTMTCEPFNPNEWQASNFSSQ